MTTISQSAGGGTPAWMTGIARHRGLLFPAACISMLLVLLVPLPPAILDLLLVINLAVSVVLMVTAMYVKSPLEFAVLPSLLLAVTMFRLVLNVATTRLILTAGEGGGDPKAALNDAGQVIEAFSSFVTAGSMAVGLIIFAIIFVIQFVVITKGATRIGEVAARFTLDAMPGKQMAIDADLNAGMIDEKEAKRRREEISQEADFYGAMDGASKFVRGDAVAGIIITLVNIAGGMYVGMFDRGWELAPTAELFTTLTIGDGLVSQIPAFIVSLGCGLIVTRSSSKTELGEQVVVQLFTNTKPLWIAAVFLACMSVTGLPAWPLLTLAACCAGLAWQLGRTADAELAAESQRKLREAAKTRDEPPAVESLLDVDAMELEVGYGLVKLVDAAKGGDLLDRVTLIRRQTAAELGLIVPPVRIRDNMQLGANDYAVKIRGMTVARGEVFPDQFLAMDSGAAVAPIPHAQATTEPAFGLPAFWITEPQKPEAELLNYTVVEAGAVLATHLTEVIKTHGHELLSRQEVRGLIDHLKAKSPALVEEVIPAIVKPGELQKVLQNLLRERVPIRDLEAVVETLGDYAPRTKDLDILTEYARNALARTICKGQVDETDTIHCVTLDPALEDLISGHIQRTETGSTITVPPTTMQTIVQKVAERVAELTSTGRPATVVCTPTVRSAVRKIIEGTLPQVAVLGYNEIVPEVKVEAVGMVGLNA